jgi:hypothetical protein
MEDLEVETKGTETDKIRLFEVCKYDESSNTSWCTHCL